MTVRDVLPRDAIPSIDDPAFGSASTYFGEPMDEVIVLEADDEPARAYPIRVLSYHEIVNDLVGDRPVAVTFCPICGSAAVYDRRVDDRVLTFGVSGKLADDALVMYDRETGSEWRQPTGRAIAGEFEGATLEALPVGVLTWERFRTDHPDGVALQPIRGTAGGNPSPREVYEMAPYERYDRGEPFGLYGMRGEGERRSWDRTDLEAKTVVLGIEHGGEAVGYPRPRVEAVRADGTTWDPATGESADGRRLERLPAIRLYAFAWQDGHGPAHGSAGRTGRSLVWSYCEAIGEVSSTADSDPPASSE